MNVLQLLGSGLGAAALLSAAFFGKDRTANETSQLANIVAPPADAPDAPPLPSIDDYGGAKDTLLPPLTGVSNRENKRGHVPRVFGKNVPVFPAIAAHPYSIQTLAGSTLYVVYEFGPGPLTLSNFKISGRPISEFPTVATEVRNGEPGDTPLTYYTSDVEQEPFNEILRPSVGLTKRTGQPCTSISVTIVFPDGIWREENGVKMPAQIDFGNVVAKVGGGYTYVDYFSVSLLSIGPHVITRSYSVPLGMYDVLVGRSPALVSNTIPDTLHDAYWTEVSAWAPNAAFVDYKDANGNKINFCRVAVQAVSNASTPNLSGALGEFSAEATSLLRPHDGTSWQTRIASANPSWAMLEVLTGSANYRPAPDSRIDFPAFKAFGDWCDSKGFEFNYVFESGEKLEDVLNTIAAAGRGYFIPNKNGKYSVGIDRAVDTVAAHFTPRNIVKGTFSARGSYVEPIDYLAVQFQNADVDYQLDERKVFADGKIEGVDFKRQVLQLIGVKNKDHAYKLGRYHLADHLLRLWIYQFEVDVEGLPVERGDKVRITHDLLGWGLGQGRITAVATNGSGDATGISIDSRQAFEVGKRYQLRMVLPDGESVVREVVNTANETKTFTFIETISHLETLPEVGYMAHFGELGNDSVEASVISSEPTEDFGTVITCVDYIPGVYTADEGTIPAWSSSITYPRRREVNIPAPSVVAVQSNEDVLDRAGDGSLKTRILVTLGGLPDYVDQIEWQIRRVGSENWSPSTFVSAIASSFSIYDVEEKRSYDLQIWSRKGNYRSPVTLVSGHTVIGKTTPPPDVPRIVEKEPDSTFIKWFYDSQHGVTVPRDHAGFVVKMNWGSSDDWNQGYILSPLHVSTRFDIGGLAFGVKTIMIKAIDVAGNEQSGAPAIIQLDFGEAPVENVLYEVDHVAASFSLGTKVNCTVDGATLKNDDSALFYGPDDAPFYGPDEDLFYQSQFVDGTYTWKFTPPSDEPKPFKVKVAYTISGAYRLEYRTHGSGFFYGNDNDLFYGPDDELFYGEGDLPFQPVPDAGIEGDYIEYEFRLTLLGGPEQTVVSDLRTVVDVADVVEYVDDFLIDDEAGKRPTLSTTFRGVKRVRATLQSSLSHPDARSVAIADKSTSGPLVVVYDSAGAGTTGIVDLEILGW